MGKKKRIEVSEYELSVLGCLWHRGEATIREIADDVYGHPADAVQYATAQKLLERLEAKKCVRRDRRSHKHLFKALVAREELIDNSLDSLASKLCAGSLNTLFLRLAGKVKLTGEERDEIRRMIDDAD
ncbi:MAG: BlaI/MecI/CopY family transcriptional regulator [Planctomycetales bacterium]|nr:BlaI/MecI/CopY family transcriptional regulator [Planctomycetales bacterium]